MTISTGIAALDASLGGWKPGQLILVCGRPAAGKTSLLLGSAQRSRSAIFILELTATETFARMQQAGKILRVDDTPNITPAHILEHAEPLLASGLELITIDYLQLLHGRRSESREVELQSIARGLKSIAKELKVPIVLAAQLARAPRRQESPLSLDDLRQSANVESDADVVLLVERPGNEATIRIAKNRDGKTGAISARWCADALCFK